MLPAVHITASCVMHSGQAWKDGQAVFNNEGSLPDFLIALFQSLDLKYPRFYKMDLLSKLGWLGTEILLQGFDRDSYQPEDIGVVFMNANSSLDADIRYYQSVADTPSPSLFVYTLPNIVMGEISIRHRLKGENAFFIRETFDADFLAQYVMDLFNNNHVRACICGWIEALENNYQLVLFLAEKENTRKGVVFTPQHLNNIYQS